MDKKKKNINQPKNNTYWMYGLIISIFIIFSYIGNGDNFSTTKHSAGLRNLILMDTIIMKVENQDLLQL